ncbi:Co2+/Mg2+ efflux protein ApaG [Alloalcanivorax profundimaris]|uniref:Co2+/Mg2+ efflux protein ApaG n=1 Tax=Alloalcanivorax profundimaris TaxID=2735259 RepID=UPI0018872034|nr:Co2+/Mg2+ efflux protein ApaG [Alloalcanivorax profundimaris]MBF1802160.1 Co2+/Mg2+ efflux protein ApaG [Alloalcanivorax profundimaris]
MTAVDENQYRIQVSVETEYLADQSDEENHRWVFAYHIRIRNRGDMTARLLTRHWVITDGEERTREVHGEGVVGEQPSIAPGQEYQYSSGAVLETEVGTMHGSYQMLAEDGTCFEADIPAFTLAVPRALH